LIAAGGLSEAIPFLCSCPGGHFLETPAAKLCYIKKQRKSKMHFPGSILIFLKDVVEKYLDCGNSRCGFALIRKAHEGQTKRRSDTLPRLSGRAPADVFL
jgi:hypothetical protein